MLICGQRVAQTWTGSLSSGRQRCSAQNIFSIRISPFPSRDHLFHQDFIFSIRISSLPSGFHHADVGPWSRPAAHNDGEADLGPHWELPSYAGLFHLTFWFVSNYYICSDFSDLQPGWSCILVSPRLLCQSYLLLPQPLGRQNSSSSMGLTKFLQLGLVRIVNVDLN